MRSADHDGQRPCHSSGGLTQGLVRQEIVAAFLAWGLVAVMPISSLASTLPGAWRLVRDDEVARILYMAPAFIIASRSGIPDYLADTGFDAVQARDSNPVFELEDILVYCRIRHGGWTADKTV